MTNRPNRKPKHEVVNEIQIGKSFEVEDSETSNCSDLNSYSEDHHSLTSSEGGGCTNSIDDDDLSTCDQGMDKVKDRGDGDRSSIRGESCSIDDTVSLSNEPSLISSFSSDAQDDASPISGRRRSSNDGSSEESMHVEEHTLEDSDDEPLDQYANQGIFIGGQLPSSFQSLPQLRHRREYEFHPHQKPSFQNSQGPSIANISSITSISGHEAPDGLPCLDHDENSLSPSAKHKPVPSTMFLKENKRISFARRSELLKTIMIQFSAMTVAVYYILTTTHGYNATWRMPSLRNSRRLVKRIEALAGQRRRQALNLSRSASSMSTNGFGTSQLSNSFIIRLRGGRLDLMRRSLDQHAHCRLVRQVQIDWEALDGSSEAGSSHLRVDFDDDFPDELLKHRSGKVVRLGAAHGNNKQHGASDGIFMLTEGVSLSCLDLERAFYEWSIDPVRVVGFFPDLIDSTAQYSLISDRAMFVHRLYLSTRSSSQLLQSTPDLPRECHHLALSAYVSSVSSHTPLAIATSASGASDVSYKRNSIKDVSAKNCSALLLQAAGVNSVPTVQTNFLGHHPNKLGMQR